MKILISLLVCSQLCYAERSVEYFKQIIVPELCAKGEFFATCFTPVGGCEKSMTEIVSQCAAENKNLFSKKSNDTDKKLSDQSIDIRMGFCLGKAFENKYYQDKKDNPECYTTKKWK